MLLQNITYFENNRCNTVHQLPVCGGWLSVALTILLGLGGLSGGLYKKQSCSSSHSLQSHLLSQTWSGLMQSEELLFWQENVPLPQPVSNSIIEIYFMMQVEEPMYGTKLFDSYPSINLKKKGTEVDWIIRIPRVFPLNLIVIKSYSNGCRDSHTFSLFVPISKLKDAELKYLSFTTFLV